MLCLIEAFARFSFLISLRVLWESWKSCCCSTVLTLLLLTMTSVQPVILHMSNKFGMLSSITISYSKGHDYSYTRRYQVGTQHSGTNYYVAAVSFSDEVPELTSCYL